MLGIHPLRLPLMLLLRQATTVYLNSVEVLVAKWKSWVGFAASTC